MEVICNFVKLTLVQIPEQQSKTAEHLYPESEVPSSLTPAPNDPPWTSPVAFGVWMVSVLLILVLPSFFLLPYITTIEPRIEETKALIEFAKSDKTAIFLQVLSIIPAHVLTLLMAWLVVTRGRKFSFRQTLGWENGGIRWWHYVAILCGFLAIAAAVASIVPEQENDLIRILRSSRATVYIVVFMATFTAPIVEEVIYRGLLYSAFQRTIGVPAAFTVVTLLFAVVHVPQYYPSYSTIFLLTLLSVTLTALRVRSRNLLPCIVLHMLFNGIQSVLILIESGSGFPVTHEQAATFLGLVK